MTTLFRLGRTTLVPLADKIILLGMERASITTRLAQVERIEPDVVVVRYVKDVNFDIPGIAEVLAACEALPLSESFAMISIFPKEGGIDLKAMQQEHSTEGMARRVKASAMVVSGQLFRRLTEIHYNYHPQHFAVRMFSDMDEAQAWVRACLDEQPPH